MGAERQRGDCRFLPIGQCGIKPDIAGTENAGRHCDQGAPRGCQQNPEDVEEGELMEFLVTYLSRNASRRS
jgi:hypothetical protein